MKKIFFLVLIAVLLTACSMTHSTLVFMEEFPAGNDEVVLYFYRVPKMLSAAYAFPVLIDNVKYGMLKQNAYFTVHIQPGKHQIQSPQIVNVEFKPGYAYIFRFSPFMEIFEIGETRSKIFGTANSVVLPLSESSAQSIFSELKNMKYDNGINVVINR